MMDPYCPLVTHTRLPDNANLVAPKGGAAGSMPINTPEVPLSSLSFLLDDFSFQVRHLGLPMHILEWGAGRGGEEMGTRWLRLH